MDLKNVRIEIAVTLPQAKGELEFVMKRRTKLFREAYGEKTKSAIDELDRLKEQERFLVGIVGAMTRLDDQIFRYGQTTTERLSKGVAND